MQKKIGVILLLVLLFILTYILLFFNPALAEEENFELRAGLNYNFLEFESLNEYFSSYNDNYLKIIFPNHQGMKELKDGIGAFIQGRYWLTDRLTLGGDIESSISSTDIQIIYGVQGRQGYGIDEVSYELILTGISGIIAYNLPLNGFNIDLQLAVAKYFGTLERQEKRDLSDIFNSDAVHESFESYKGSEFGAKVGLNIEYPYRESVFLNLGLHYRYAYFDKLEDQDGKAFINRYGNSNQPLEFDFRGLETRFGVLFRF